MSETSNVGPAAELWGELYALLCRWDTIHHGLATMPESDQRVLDDLAEEIIKRSGAFSACFILEPTVPEQEAFEL